MDVSERIIMVLTVCFSVRGNHPNKKILINKPNASDKCDHIKISLQHLIPAEAMAYWPIRTGDKFPVQAPGIRHSHLGQPEELS